MIEFALEDLEATLESMHVSEAPKERLRRVTERAIEDGLIEEDDFAEISELDLLAGMGLVHIGMSIVNWAPMLIRDPSFTKRIERSDSGIRIVQDPISEADIAMIVQTGIEEAERFLASTASNPT